MITEDSQILLIQKQVRKDLLYILSFCQQRKIKPSLKNFLEYKEKDSKIPSCIYFFMSNDFCHYFFYNSKKWNSFFYSLPIDFQKDIGNPKNIQLLTKTEYNIECYLKSLLGKDFIGN